MFAGKNQLMIYHFMLGPDWEQACPSCAFWADNFDGIDIHLAQRNISFVAVSRAGFDKIAACKKRMGWRFKWVSSQQNEFNYDLGVSFGPQQEAQNEIHYNYRDQPFFNDEMPGVSVFYQDDDGAIYHTYSTYARGLDILNGAYNYIDLSPLGRHEDSGMSWVKLHDLYD